MNIQLENRVSNSESNSTAQGFVEAAQPKAGASVILDEAAECLRELQGDAIGSLTVERVVVGVFFTGVKFSDGSTGVAYTPPELIERASTRILGDTTRAYRGRKAAEMIDSSIDGPFGHVIRLAALNALSVPLYQRGCFQTAGSDDLSSISELFAGRKVCMVGAIIPLLKKLRDLGTSEIAIIDKKKETRDEATLGRFVSVEKTAETLEACQTAVFTGAAIANGTIEELLRWVPKHAAIAVVGPTAGFVPTPLFRRGVTVVGTVMVTDGDRALEVLSEGGGGYQLFKQCVTKMNLVNPPALADIKLQNP
jgi:uncharacterized protein (DUF4213/DUF364 family)